MKQSFIIHAELREAHGKGASRRLRHEGKVPAILYGGLGEAISLATSHNELMKHTRRRGFFSQLLDLEIDGKHEQVVLKDLQRHPVRDQILHVDLQRVRADKALRSRVHIEFTGGAVCPGVKNNGGIVEHHLIEVEIECLPKDLPEQIDVDLSAMDIGDVLRVSDLKLPAGVRSVATMHGRNPAVVSVQIPRAAIEAAEAEEAAAAEAAAAATAAAGGTPAAGAAAPADAAKAAAPAADAAKPEAKKPEKDKK